MSLFTYLKESLLALINEEEGQGATEYMLALGAVVVAVVLAIVAAVALTPFDTVVTQACDEVVGVMDAAATC